MTSVHKLYILLLTTSLSCDESDVAGNITETNTSTSVAKNCIYQNQTAQDFEFESRLSSVMIAAYSSMRSTNYGEEGPEDPLLEDGKIVFNEIKQQLELNKTQTDSLKKILFNFNDDGMLMGADCYFPRHAIFFLDEKDSVLAYLEVCFQCGNDQSSDPTISLGCSEQMDALQDFMKWCGITHFPDQLWDTVPGESGDSISTEK